EEIEKYVDSGEPMDKAGAYAIQGGFAKFIKEIKGEYNNVVGFPIARTLFELRKVGIFI
ncbi:MAG: Maf family protein, partial [Lachnospiraceae bacterium]|nr:Maf family protein [Lachnospiraceae bacterium]